MEKGERPPECAPPFRRQMDGAYFAGSSFLTSGFNVSFTGAVVAFGAARDEVVKAFANDVAVTPVESMREAVRAGARAAQRGDVVLLSPGCASFDMYPGGYPERGDDFIAEVQAFIAEGKTA